tara:strand:- start:333 stop:1130 length:798 start_codon:yes stop_codon:yes gene_type:complete
MMNVIGILGCGWLGIPLGKSLRESNYTVIASRRSEKGINLLRKNKLEAYQIELLPNKIKGDLSFFDLVNTLIISIPPKRKADDLSFVKKIKNVIEILDVSSVKRILFLSSTSVYGSNAGVFDENSIPNPETSSAKALFEVEKILLNCKIPVIIIRLGGLVGKDRNPIVYLQNKKITNPDGRINFIDQIDAINGVLVLLKQPQIEGVYNLVSPHHPSRREYYNFISVKLKFPNPKFKKDDPLIRIIKGEKIIDDTTFKYIVNNLLI